jgi:protein-S-isoprenylcysteine O-methyltransferase Ste14
MVGVLIRAVTYATVFIGVVLVYMPNEALAMAGVVRPARLGPFQIAGLVTTAMGAALVLWCIGSFVVLGRGTPAPFDPPRRLVVQGPYRHVRNPMYLGAGLALAGAALFYETVVLAAYAGAFMVVMHLFVVLYEEPTLRHGFGDAYEDYRRTVRRWWPRIVP